MCFSTRRSRWPFFHAVAAQACSWSWPEPLRTQLQTQWLARWPKQLWRPGDYDTLAGGFKKFRFCFITTATCAAEGKPDDCAS